MSPDMLFDLVALGLLALFGFLGSRRGGVAAGTGLFALVAGYTCAVWAGSRFGAAMSHQLAVAEILGPPLAGSLGFLLAFTVFSLLGALLRRFDRQRLGIFDRSALDRAFGATFGLLRGALIVVLLSFLAVWVDAAREFEVSEGLASVPPLGSSRVARASGAVVEGIAMSAVADQGPMAALAVRLAVHPTETLNSMQNLLDHEGFEELQSDRLFWTYVQHGAIDNAVNRGSFLRFSEDDELRAELANLALITPEEAADPQAFRRAIAEAIEAAGPHLKALSEDRALERLAEDPEILALLEAGDTFALVTHPKIREVLDRVTAAL